MKLLFTIALIILGFNARCQELKCCNNEDGIKNILQGDWMILNTEHRSIYEFKFEETDEQCIIVQEFNGENLVFKNFKHETNIKIAKDEVGFMLEWNSKRFKWKSRILKLKSNKLIVEINGSEIVFRKT